MDHQNWKVSYIISKNPKGTSNSDSGVSTGGPSLVTNKKMPGKAPHLVDDDIMKGIKSLSS